MRNQNRMILYELKSHHIFTPWQAATVIFWLIQHNYYYTV